ncbi:MAG: FMN-binding protein [Actinobacteria bacterium]|nr:FMN-binding protein [Actinomycetota bacterium]
MRTRAVLGSIFASTAVLVVGWQAGAAVVASTATSTSQPAASGTASTATTTTTTTTTPSTAASATPSATATPVATGAADGTYTGSSVNTRFGSVQVSVTIANGAITDVTALHLTDADGRSVQISNRAAPMLRDEVIASQSANVSTVGGATYTSDAYLTSVQSALDQAGF